MTAAEQHEWHQSFLRRHAVSRRRLLQGAGAGLGAFALGPAVLSRGALAASRSGVAVTNRHISFGDTPARSMRVAGQLSQNPGLERIWVEVGHNSAYGHRVEAEVRPLRSSVPQADGSLINTEQFYVHADLDRLPAGETLHYRFRTAGGLATPDATFALAPHRAKPFTFTAFGDEGSATGVTGFTNATADAVGILAQLKAQNPAFHLVAGDICYADPSGTGGVIKNGAPSPFDAFNPLQWDYYLAQIETSAASTPWMFGTGNHDIESIYTPDGYGGHLARLDFPGNGPHVCPSVYSFVYGNVAVVALDPNDVSYEIPANLDYSNGMQTSWLERRLAELRADPRVDFIVVFFHHCAYSTTNQHASEGGIREYWAPLFDKYHVDLAISGHNHIYERSDPIRRGRPTMKAETGSSVEAKRHGTTYITMGASGRSLYSFPVPDTIGPKAAPNPETVQTYFSGPSGKVTETVEWSRVRYTGYALVAVDVTPAGAGGRATMTVRTVAENGAELDRVQLLGSRPVIRG